MTVASDLRTNYGAKERQTNANRIIFDTLLLIILVKKNPTNHGYHSLCLNSNLLSRLPNRYITTLKSFPSPPPLQSPPLQSQRLSTWSCGRLFQKNLEILRLYRVLNCNLLRKEASLFSLKENVGKVIEYINSFLHPIG